MPINSYMWTGDKFSTWYSGVYEIAIEDDMTKEYAEDLAKKFAKWFGELTFTFIDTSPALPDSVPDSSEFSRDSEDEVQAGIERKRIW